MFDVRKHPATLADAAKAYAKSTSWSMRFLIAENKHMAKELQVAKQKEKQATTSAKAELKKAILDDVSSLVTIMRKFYFKFVTLHKSVVYLNGWQQCCARRARILADIHIAINHMQIWTMRYKGAPLQLPKMMKPKMVELKARIWS